MIMEVKSCTLVVDRHGFFPDAPTTRGARHLRELTRRAQSGKKAAVLFCVQRSDCEAVSPNRETDPDFAQALQAAASAGVDILAVRCNVGKKRIAVFNGIRIEL